MELMIDRGSGQESAAKATAFSQQVQFRFDPLYYGFQSIGFQVSDTDQVPVLESVKAYSGEFDISKDALIYTSAVGTSDAVTEPGGLRLRAGFRN